jgi:SPFH domain / Band 7 family
VSDDADDFGRTLITARRLDPWLGLYRRAPAEARGRGETVPAPRVGVAEPQIPRVSGNSSKEARRARFSRAGVTVPRGPIVSAHSLVATLVLVLAVWLTAGFYKVEPDQVGVVMRFGRFVDKLGPGLHYHWPIPIETVLLPRVTEINELRLGNGGVAPMLTRR